MQFYYKAEVNFIVETKAIRAIELNRKIRRHQATKQNGYSAGKTNLSKLPAEINIILLGINKYKCQQVWTPQFRQQKDKDCQPKICTSYSLSNFINNGKIQQGCKNIIAIDIQQINSSLKSNNIQLQILQIISSGHVLLNKNITAKQSLIKNFFLNSSPNIIYNPMKQLKKKNN
ncbi:hypothetical protein ABPG74_000625 [Tetrahymena malaccensis]